MVIVCFICKCSFKTTSLTHVLDALFPRVTIQCGNCRATTVPLAGGNFFTAPDYRANRETFEGMVVPFRWYKVVVLQNWGFKKNFGREAQKLLLPLLVKT